MCDRAFALGRRNALVSGAGGFQRAKQACSQRRGPGAQASQLFRPPPGARSAADSHTAPNLVTIVHGPRTFTCAQHEPVPTEEWHCGSGSPEGDAPPAHPFRSGRIGASKPLAADSITFPTRIGFVATIWNAVAGSVMPGSNGYFLTRPKKNPYRPRRRSRARARSCVRCLPHAAPVAAQSVIQAAAQP